MAIIDKLRFVDILSPHLGSDSSREFTDALQDEMKPLAGEEKLDLMMAQIDVRFAQMEVRMWRMGLALAALLLTAMGIATALIIALN